MDPWMHRTTKMLCRTCMWYVIKAHLPPNEIEPEDADPMIHRPGIVTAKEREMLKGQQPTEKYHIGRCRRHSPTMNGYPVVFDNDWCGDHKLDENAC